MYNFLIFKCAKPQSNIENIHVTCTVADQFQPPHELPLSSALHVTHLHILNFECRFGFGVPIVR